METMGRGAPLGDEGGGGCPSRRSLRHNFLEGLHFMWG